MVTVPDDALGLRLGQGIAFPFAAPHGRIETLSGPELVRQSILLILDCEPGERVMRPTFGAGLRRHIMSPNTPPTRAEIAADVERALTQWEPRIDLREVSVVPDANDDGIAWITIVYAHVRDGSPATLDVRFDLDGGAR